MYRLFPVDNTGSKSVLKTLQSATQQAQHAFVHVRAQTSKQMYIFSPLSHGLLDTNYTLFKTAGGGLCI